jgi:putative membrane protein
MKKAVLALALVAVLGTPSFAQSVGEKTGINSTLGIAPKTEDFIKEAAMSDMTEIESAKIAQQKGNAEEKMLADHTKTSTELKTFGLRLQSQLYQPADGFGHVQRTYTI